MCFEWVVAMYFASEKHILNRIFVILYVFINDVGSLCAAL